MRAPLLLFLAACSSTTSNQKKPADGPSLPVPDAAVAAAADEGSFKYTVGGQPVGEETFKIVPAADGSKELTAKAIWRLGGQEIQVDSDLFVDTAFRPERGTLKHVAGDKTTEMTLERKEGVLELSSPAAKEPFKEKEASDLFIHDRVLSHWTPICVIGGGDGGQVHIFPGLALDVGPPQNLESGGRKLVRHAVAAASGAFFDVVCDGAKLVLFAQASAHLVGARPGFEALAAQMAKGEQRKPAVPAGVQELERQVRVRDGVLLGCSLVLPAERRSPLPSVVLLTGSGSQDRDEDSPGGRPVGMAFYKHLSIALAQGGVASLRCDDRGVGKSGGTPATTTLDSLVVDASAQVAQLRAEPGLDPKRVGVVGHSEGGVVASMVAEKDKDLKAVALLASMGRPLDVLSLEQREAALKQMGAPADEIVKEQKRFARVYAAIKAGKPLPSDTPEDERKSLEPMIPYLASHFRHDPEKTLRKVKIPVLVARGDKDFHVSGEDQKVIVDALKKGGNRRVEVKTYPGLSHMFAPSKTGTIADYSDPSLAIDLGFIGDVVTFLARSL